MMNRMDMGLVIFTAALASGAAEAQILSQARARLQSLTYSVYDATPGDGVDASATFLDPINALRTLLYVGVYRTEDGEDVSFKDQTVFAAQQETLLPAPTTVGIFPAEGAGGAGGAWYQSSGLQGAQGQALERGKGFYAYAGISTTATGQLSPTFYNLILGPGTGVRISAVATVEAWLSSSGVNSYADAEVMASFSERASDGSYQSKLAVTNTDAIAVGMDRDYSQLLPGGQLTRVSDSRNLTVSYENLTDADQIGRVRYQVSADGTALPVPEPGMAWMLGAGLLLVVPVSVRSQRRERSRNQPQLGAV